jgi:predicted nucleotidyltransferase
MSTVEKVSLALSNDLLKVVRRAVASGEYASSSEVVREALREWRARRPAFAPTASVQQILTERDLQLRALCEQFDVSRLSLFGSALREDFDPARSDVDLSVEFGNAAALTAREFFALQAGLAALFGREVDLVDIDAMTDSRLKRSILRSQRAIYQRAQAT